MNLEDRETPFIFGKARFFLTREEHRHADSIASHAHRI